MSKKRIFRDYRPGSKGQFASEETFNRSTGQGVDCHIHREFVETGQGEEVTVEDLFDYEDYDVEDLDVYEFHGSGDTGRRK